MKGLGLVATLLAIRIYDQRDIEKEMLLLTNDLGKTLRKVWKV